MPVKAKYRCPPEINRGYTPPKAESLAGSLGRATAADLFEAVNVGTAAADFPGLGLPGDVYAENVYPADEVPGFEAAVTAWFEAAGRVARTMVRAADEQLPAARPRRAPRAGPARHGRAYRLRHRDRALGRPGARLVNLGDALARWTNEEWISTLHRVAPPRRDGVLVPRRSAAYFHDGNVDAVIEPLPGCVTAGNPAARLRPAQRRPDDPGGRAGGENSPERSHEPAKTAATP